MESKEDNKIKSQENYNVFYNTAEDETCQFVMQVCQEYACEFKIERPKIGICLFFLGLIVPMVLVLGIVLIVVLMEHLWKYAICVGLFIILSFLLKYIAFLWIKIYQRYAPQKIRQACLFNPSCSQYMLLAIEKYGFWKGFWKGLKRLARCHYPNGGEDYP